MVDIKIILGAEVARTSNNAHSLVISTNRAVLHRSLTLTNVVEIIIDTNNLFIIRSKPTNVASRIKRKIISSEVTRIFLIFCLLMLLDWLSLRTLVNG